MNQPSSLNFEIKAMPEADLPINQRTETPVITSGELSHAYLSDYPVSGENDDWQILNLPGTIEIDSIPDASPLELGHPYVPSLDLGQFLGSQNTKESATLVQALHECNRDLAKRIAELELTLSELQKELFTKDKLLSQRNLEVSAAQEQVTKLYHQLKLAHHVIQRQEVEAENWQKHLAGMQMRVAQMERDCVATQQRYEQQVLRLAIAENNNRELRSRLHRQQAQTLQFKVALENYLAANEQLNSADFNLTISSNHAQKSVQIPQISPVNMGATPVQPWSAERMVSLPIVNDQDGLSEKRELIDLELPKIQKIANYGYLTPLTPELIASVTDVTVVNSLTETEVKNVGEGAVKSPVKSNIPAPSQAELTNILEEKSTSPHQPEDPEILRVRKVFTEAKISRISRSKNSSPPHNSPLSNQGQKRNKASGGEIELPSFPVTQ